MPIGISIAVLVLCLLYIALKKSIYPDEVESLAGATLIFDGFVPYKDFWQIHTPLFYYFIAPLCFFFKSMKIIYALRAVIFCILLLNGYFVYLIIKLFLSKKAALLGALSYFVCLPVLNIEVRPDILAAIFSNLSLLLLLSKQASAGRYFFLSGFSAALALLFKQSGSFCILSITIFFIFRSMYRNDGFWDRSIFSKDRFNLKNYCLFAAGLILPCVGFYWHLLHQGAWDAFLQGAVKNDFLNSFLFLKVESRHWFPAGYLKQMVLADLPLFLSAAALFVYIILYRKRVDTLKFNAFVMASIFFVVAFGALFMILHPWRWEFLLSSQYLVLLAIPVLIFVYEAVFIFFEQKDKGAMGVIFNCGMLCCLCLPPVYQTFKTAKFDLPESIKVYDQIISLTNKDDKCFSVVPIPFRRNVYYYHIGSVLVESPMTRTRVENTLIDEILHENIIVIVPNHRYRQMKSLVSLINDHYIKYTYSNDPNDQGHFFYVSGKIINSATAQTNKFVILVEGYYRIQAWGEKIYLDGKAVGNSIVYIKKGGHFVNFLNDQPKSLMHQKTCRIIYDFQANKRGP